ncbi:cell division protein FtsA [Clostridium manihotivorum]|uniref:Cell division protein FtsA n=1 Tax=Clostridium manihotivorum TaxID=2320868 RepID=A0A3R5VA86_9CLOT|nr:cell division protein FtsA [Clostridium manihotivorum]QAA33734.1 cell division protein FtsA [Clostridium manihotivorum]
MQRTIVGIDIGNDNISASVAKVNGDDFEVISSIFVPSKGLSKGKVVNLNHLTESLKDCIDQIKKDTNIDFKSVFVGISSFGTRLVRSKGLSVMDSRLNIITPSEVKEALSDAQNIKLDTDEIIVDVVPESFLIDDNVIVEDPLAMKASKLQVNCAIVVGKRELINSYRNAFSLSGLEIEGVYINSLELRKIILNKKTKDEGILIVDAGSDTTEITLYKGNELSYMVSLPVGGYNITKDISICLQVPEDQAEVVKYSFSENYKTLYREHSIGTLKDNTLGIDIKLFKDVIESRIDEIVTLIYKDIKESGYLDEISNIYIFGNGLSMFQDVKYFFEDRMRKKTVIVTKNQLELQNSCIINSIGIVKDASDRLKLIYEHPLNNESNANQDDEINNKKKKSGLIRNFKRLIDDFF